MRMEIISIICSSAIGVATVGATVWTTSTNLKGQYELFNKTAQSQNEQFRLTFNDNREREEINLRRQKLELLTELISQLYSVCRNELTKELFDSAALSMYSTSHFPKLIQITNNFYALKLRVNGLTTLYFPELTASFNKSFDAILEDADAFVSGKNQTSPLRNDVFLYISAERKNEHLSNYNAMIKQIRIEAEKLNQLSKKYDSIETL